jgi:PAS domain S-box-containing protein
MDREGKLPFDESSGGRIARHLNRVAWEETDVGPLAGWPNILRSAVTFCLSSNFPLQIWWGNKLTMFYNDACAPMLSHRTKEEIAVPASRIWREQWPDFATVASHFLNEKNNHARFNAWPMQVSLSTGPSFLFRPIFSERGELEGVWGVCYVAESPHQPVLPAIEFTSFQARDLAKINRTLLENESHLLKTVAALRARVARLEATRLDPTDFAGATHVPTSDETAAVQHETAERQRVQDALFESHENLTMQLKVMESLHTLTLHIRTASTLEAALDSVLHAACELLAAPKGTIQVREQLSPPFRLCSVVGFDRAQPDKIPRLDLEPPSTFATALREGKRTVLSDGQSADQPPPFKNPHSIKEFRAAQFTPLRTRDDRLIGVLATYWPSPALPSEREFQILDLYAREAVELIERLQSNAALRDSEERLRIALRAARMGTWDWNLLTGEILWSAEHNKLYDLPADRRSGSYDAFMASVHPDDRLHMATELAYAAKHHSHFVAEMRTIHRDGSLHWIEGNAQTVYDAGGKAVRMVGVVRDITEQKTATEKLRASRRRLAAIFSQAAVGLSEISVTGQIKRVNGAACLIVGRTQDEILRLSASDLTHPDDKAKTLEAFANLLRHNVSASFDNRCVRPDGRIVWVQTLFTRLDNDQGEPDAVLAVTVDVTARKDAEELLLLVHRKLESRVQMRTTELNKLNHTLRLEMSDRIRAEEERQQMMHHLVVAQEVESSRLSRELHDGVSQHLTALTLGLKSLEVELREKGRELVSSLQAITEAMGQEIHAIAVELRPTALDDLGLPRTLSNYIDEWAIRAHTNAQFHASGFEIFQVPAHIETTLYRIVVEALNNILKHAAASQVSVILHCHSEHVTAIIDDNGIGIQNKAASDSVKKNRLGLVGMKERAALLDGEVTIESIPGQGTAVFVRIPYST